MHCCIDGLSWLVCSSGAGFANHVKSWLRQWGPWRALDGRYGSHIYPCVSEASLKALQACLGLRLEVLGLIATPNSPIGRHNLPPDSHSPTTNPTHPLICAMRNITVALKKVAQNHAVLASYYWWSCTTSQNTALVIQQIQHGYNIAWENHGSFNTSNQHILKCQL